MCAWITFGASADFEPISVSCFLGRLFNRPLAENLHHGLIVARVPGLARSAGRPIFVQSRRRSAGGHHVADRSRDARFAVRLAAQLFSRLSVRLVVAHPSRPSERGTASANLGLCLRENGGCA